MSTGCTICNIMLRSHKLSPEICVVSWARDVCSSNLAIEWTVNQDDSLVLFTGSSQMNESLGEIRTASR